MTTTRSSFRVPVYDYYYDPYYYRYKYWYPSYLDYDYSIYPYTSRYLARLEADEDLRRARRLRYLDLVERENLRASLRAKELNRSLKVDVDQKIQAVSTDVKTLSKSVSDLKQLSTTIDTIEKQSPIQIVQNFKTMVGYERRITTDEMGKYYADKQSVQRIIYLAFIETFKVVETLFDIVKSKSKLREKTVERVISRVRISSNDILKHSAEEALSSFVSKLTDVARKVQTTDYSILLERQLLASEYEVLDEHLYRRSFDSSYNTSRVKYFITPPLMSGSIVIVKGEAFTEAK